jgi:hypothetical protein
MSSLSAPLRVPVELRLGDPALGAPRWFRLTESLSVDGMELGHDLPDALDREPLVTLHLPGDRQPLSCRARVVETVVGEGDHERAARRALALVGLEEADRLRIQTYVHLRLGIVA